MTSKKSGPPAESPASLSVSDAAAGIRTRRLSPVDLVKACLAVIEHRNPELNAFCQVRGEEALAEARILEAEAVQGCLRGPLHGIPIGVKDLFHVAGWPTARGSRLYEGQVSTTSAPIVERCVQGGAILLGKTTTPEFGWKASGLSPLYGVTRNPWDPRKNSGGSSSGSAAAVAARMVPAALGSDGGGSIRIPASFCGIFGFKPSLGLIPTHPWSATEMLSHAGPMARDVRDTALLLDVLKGPHPRCHNSLPEERASFERMLDEPAGELRCLFAPALFGFEVEAEIAGCVREALGRIPSDSALKIRESSPAWPSPCQIFETLWVAGRGVAYGSLAPASRDLFDPGFARIVRAAEKYSVKDYLGALEGRARFCETVFMAFEAFDLLLLPTVPVPPFAAEEEGPPWMNSTTDLPWIQWTPFTYPFNLTGQPAASIPCGFTKAGLPVGLQVVGNRFQDGRVLQACRLLERTWGA